MTRQTSLQRKLVSREICTFMTQPWHFLLRQQLFRSHSGFSFPIITRIVALQGNFVALHFAYDAESMLRLVVVSYVACGLQRSSTNPSRAAFLCATSFAIKKTGFVQNHPEIKDELALKKLSRRILQTNPLSFIVCLFDVRRNRISARNGVKGRLW